MKIAIETTSRWDRPALVSIDGDLQYEAKVSPKNRGFSIIDKLSSVKVAEFEWSGSGVLCFLARDLVVGSLIVHDKCTVSFVRRRWTLMLKLDGELIASSKVGIGNMDLSELGLTSMKFINPNCLVSYLEKSEVAFEAIIGILVYFHYCYSD